MNKDIVDWDDFYSKVGFSELRTLAPEFWNRRLPTCYSRDRKFIYLSSLDEDIGTENEENLRSALRRVRESYTSSINRKNINIQDAYLSKVDFYAICETLYTLTGNEEFADPEFSLNNPE